MNLVEAGEQAGALETLLDKIATYKEKTEALKKKIKKALFYPAAVLVVAVIVTLILLIFVIPQFEALFKGFGADLPAFTQLVIDMSQVRADTGLVDRCCSSAARSIAFFYFKKRSTAMRAVHRPHVAQDPDHRPDPRTRRRSRASRARCPRCSRAGVPLVEALESVAGATGNIVYEDAVLRMRDEVATGQRLQRAMENTGSVPEHGHPDDRGR